MTTFDLNEFAVAALVQRLKDDLPGQVAAINAAAAVVADGYTITEPAEILDYVPSPDAIGSWGPPTIGVQDGGSLFGDDTGFSATGDHELAVVIFVGDADQQALTRRLRRYQRAIASAALRDRRLAPGVYGTRLKRIRPGPTLDREQGPQTWVTWTAVVIGCLVDED